ncbi:hypothetical protein GOODEAATRI_019431 [Goodea atripinnis]|uniref:Saposin B-type domain-containing protein n=1 Tax=Goodea atripinnis TaxID=208336 RepID=A0ABV0PFJ8_9TELE
MATLILPLILLVGLQGYAAKLCKEEVDKMLPLAITFVTGVVVSWRPESEVVIKLLDEICHILPRTYRNQCEAIIGKFSKTVLDAILGYATPEAICALIHQCKGQEAVAGLEIFQSVILTRPLSFRPDLDLCSSCYMPSYSMVL